MTSENIHNYKTFRDKFENDLVVSQMWIDYGLGELSHDKPDYWVIISTLEQIRVLSRRMVESGRFMSSELQGIKEF